MSGLDEFESVFKAASKERYEHSPIDISKVLVVTDTEGEPRRLFLKDVRDFTAKVLGEGVEWVDVGAGDFGDAGELLELVERCRPDVIFTYRNLHGPARGFPFSLGAHVDVLTQATTTPLLLLPQLTGEGRLAPSCEHMKDVLVITDHLTGSNRLVDWGVRFTEPDGQLLLVHLEDDAVFDRYIEVISRLPSLDTDTAREDIPKQLLKEPADYIRSIREELNSRASELRVESIVEMGHRVTDVKRLTTDHEVDVLVMNTKDDEQLAMHGLAYPLAIELRDVPLLLL